MKFRTEIKPAPAPFRIDENTRILTAGSCFARHAGAFLKEHFFPVRVNPFGTLFHPLSLTRLFERVANKDFFTEDDIFYDNGLWKSFELYTLFNRPEKESFLENVNTLIENEKQALHETDLVIVTYGTAQVFVDKHSGQAVANCHKLPGSHFERRMLSATEITEATGRIYRAVKRLNPHVRFIFSVSPVRYLQDGMTANIRSKGRLIDATVSFCDAHPEDTYYFPAFEIFNDDLRDYRFYAADLIHPGEQGIEYTMEIFTEIFFDAKGKQLLRETEKLYKMLAHKPLQQDAARHRPWQRRMEETARLLKKKYPALSIPDYLLK